MTVEKEGFKKLYGVPMYVPNEVWDAITYAKSLISEDDNTPRFHNVREISYDKVAFLAGSFNFHGCQETNIAIVAMFMCRSICDELSIPSHMEILNYWEEAERRLKNNLPIVLRMVEFDPEKGGWDKLVLVEPVWSGYSAEQIADDTGNLHLPKDVVYEELPESTCYALRGKTGDNNYFGKYVLPHLNEIISSENYFKVPKV